MWLDLCLLSLWHAKVPKTNTSRSNRFATSKKNIVPDERSGFQTIVIGPLSSTQQIGPLQKHGGIALKLTDATFVVTATGGEGVVARFRHAAFHIDVFDVVVSVVSAVFVATGVVLGGSSSFESESELESSLLDTAMS